MILFCVLILLAGCKELANPTDAPLTEITVQLRWTHIAQFAGFYAADQNGYYAAEGLTVRFLEGGPTVDLHTPVLDGRAQLGVAGADTIIVKLAEGKPLRAIATIFRRSPVAFFALADSGITRPQDFVGKTINVPGTVTTVFRTMMNRVRIRPDQYTEVNVGTDLSEFYEGRVQVWTGFVTQQPYTIQNAGYKINIIYPDDYGIHFYADVIFANDEWIRQNPDLVTRFLRATFKGWTYVIEHPTEIGALVSKYDPNTDVKFQENYLLKSLPLVNTGEDFIGWMKPEIWADMERTLREQGVLTAPLDVTQVYTMQFIEEIYK